MVDSGNVFVSIFTPIIKFGVLLLIIWATIIIVNYRNSSYYKVTKNSLLKLLNDIGKQGEYFTYKCLKNYEKKGAKFLFNLYIPKGNDETTEIDVIMISSKGVFVFESKNYSGWIFGDEFKNDWYQTLPRGRRSHKERFYNPIWQNQSHIKHLKELIVGDIPIYSIIVFSERCTLKKIYIKSNDVKIVKRNDLFSTVTNILKINSKNNIDIESLYNKLYPYTQVDELTKEQHISVIKNKLEKKQVLENLKINDKSSEEDKLSPDMDINKNNIVPFDLDNSKVHENSEAVSVSNDINVINESKKCPKCGGNLILRTAKKGANKGNQFWGCDNYPKCRFIKEQD